MNIYDEPKQFGVTILGEVDLGGGYSYDKFVVWTSPFHGVGYATDSGCSCLMPFYETGIPGVMWVQAQRTHDGLDFWFNAKKAGGYEDQYDSYEGSIADLHRKISEV